MKKLGFGCMRLPLLDPEKRDSVDMEKFCRMVDTFLERGFTYFDTAYVYHDYQSENIVRRALVERHPRDSFTLATKLPLWDMKEDGDKERLFAEQLEKCGVDYFDYYLIHNLGEEHYKVATRFDCFGFVSRMKAEGKVRKMGFSFHDKAEVLDRILTDHPEVDFVQLQINYLDWEDEKIQSRLCYETARRHGKPVVVMEPVKGGKLADLSPAAEGLLKSRAPEASLPSWAIRFAAGLEGVMVVLSGMSDQQQLEDNTGYMAQFRPLDGEERALLERAADILRGEDAIGCTACRYCTEGCPMHIPIPDYFSLYNRGEGAEGGLTALSGEYAALAAAAGRASDCIACRQCEQTCPQHLEIVNLLKDVAKIFENQK